MFISRCGRHKSLFLFQAFAWANQLINGKRQGHKHDSRLGAHSLPCAPPISLVLIKLVGVILWSGLVFLPCLPQKQVRKALTWFSGWDVICNHPRTRTQRRPRSCAALARVWKYPEMFWWRPSHYKKFMDDWMLLKNIFNRWLFIKLYRLLP